MGKQSASRSIFARAMLAVVLCLSLLAFSGQASAQSGGAQPFVRACGTQLCLPGLHGLQPYVVHGGTAYGQYDNPVREIALAKRAHVNVIELVEFDTKFHILSDTMSSATWTRVDRFLAVARAAGMHVILHFAEYGQSLAAAGVTPTTVDWKSYLSFVANRVNTVTGIRYKDDPTIAMVELYGEIDAPNFGVPTAGTTAEMTAFFHRTLTEWHALAPHILASTGGFSYINYPNSGIDWQTIVSDPADDVCGVEVNATPDRDVSVPAMSSLCQKLGKPWFLSAWSSCYADKGFDGDIDHWSSDTEMAAHAVDMEQVAADRHPAGAAPSMPSIGSDFWNLGDTPVVKGTCDIGPQFPLTLRAVQQAGSVAPPW